MISNPTSPLAGKSIVVTRAPHQTEELCARIRSYHAHPWLYPCIDIEPPMDCSDVDEAIQSTVAGHFDWLIFTSTNTVLSIAKRCLALKIPATDLTGTASIAVVGEATAQAVHQFLGLGVDFIPKGYLADELADSLPISPGMNIFLPQADLANSVIADKLAAAFVHVHRVVAYRTVCGQGGDPIPELLQQNHIDVLTFTSPSTVKNFFLRIQNEGYTKKQLPPDLCIACIGSVTANAAISMGLSVQVLPKVHTLDHLMNDLAAYYQHKS